ncbi:MAG: hypothetical protein LBN00_02220 [Oscillospiraceae bacterium]|jgi:chromate transport protein ChrA|nr:hypothetical protein [Oscillospiraceae bacterium]
MKRSYVISWVTGAVLGVANILPLIVILFFIVGMYGAPSSATEILFGRVLLAVDVAVISLLAWLIYRTARKYCERRDCALNKKLYFAVLLPLMYWADAVLLVTIIIN